MLKAHPVIGKPKSVDICKAFIAGAPQNVEGHVFYGVNDSNVEVFRKVKASGQDWWYIDNSFFDNVRGHQFRVAKNRIQTLVGEQQSDGKRFGMLGLRLEVWHPNRKNVVVCPQSEDFMRNVAEDPLWLERVVDELTGPKIIRPWNRDKLKAQSTLAADLEYARLLVTHSSAAAITAALADVPILVSVMSSLAGVSYWNQEDADTRLHYMQVLADNQFTLEEMRNGLAWRMLNKN